MKELKFRGWATSGSVGGFVYFDVREDNDFAFHEFYSSCEADNIEQYTGLKDKNGKEIYEGDIIREEIEFNSKMTDGIFTYVVEWDDDILCYKLKANVESIHDELWEVNASVKVIGNIHENPDLLKEEE